MKPKLKTIIVGAGGVASYLLPALNNSFQLSGSLVDGDILEAHNLDRQIFSKSHIGKCKAPSLLQHHKIKTLKPVTSYVDHGFVYEIQDNDYDLIICLVDNHPARKVCIDMAEQLECSIVIGANEYSTSQAMFWNQRLDTFTGEGNLRPDIRYPSIATDDSGSPLNCTGVALDSDPQLAIANMVTAGLVNYMTWLWLGNKGSYDLSDIKGFEAIEFQTTFSKIETTTINDTAN